MKNYTEPKLEIIRIENTDIITTSGGNMFSSLYKGSGTYGSDRGMSLTSFRIG